jgi:hypothetical protein
MRVLTALDNVMAGLSPATAIVSGCRVNASAGQSKFAKATA